MDYPKKICVLLGFQKPSHTFAKIHLKALRTNILNILLTLSFTVLINTLGYSQDLPSSDKSIKPIERDSVFVATDSLSAKGLTEKKNDTIVGDTIPKKDFLEGIVKYKAKEYVSINRREQKIYLYDEAEVNYQDMNIKSGIIIIDYSKNLVYAGRLKDTLGNYTQLPVFTQGANVVEPDSIIFNTDNKKALIFNSRTEQSGGYIDAELTKKENDSVYFLKEGKFTTSEDREDPEFYFRMRKAKVVPGKKVVVGLTNMYIYNVPTPIGLPFAYFPLTNKQTSGIIFPSYGQDNNRGFNLQNGGYYFAISDYFDLEVLGDYYTNGSYGLRIGSQYALRYRFRGNINFRYENLISSERGFDD
ncbi:MAG TPA: putative LPS assembly protein LptD, partial [Aquaticitalea sp.]|nr:putative LPS assembly protein LptD [Aquaticitalea sp.]